MFETDRIDPVKGWKALEDLADDLALTGRIVKLETPSTLVPQDAVKQVVDWLRVNVKDGCADAGLVKAKESLLGSEAGAIIPPVGLVMAALISLLKGCEKERFAEYRAVLQRKLDEILTPETTASKLSQLGMSTTEMTYQYTKMKAALRVVGLPEEFAIVIVYRRLAHLVEDIKACVTSDVEYGKLWRVSDGQADAGDERSVGDDGQETRTDETALDDSAGELERRRGGKARRRSGASARRSNEFVVSGPGSHKSQQSSMSKHNDPEFGDIQSLDLTPRSNPHKNDLIENPLTVNHPDSAEKADEVPALKTDQEGGVFAIHADRNYPTLGTQSELSNDAGINEDVSAAISSGASSSDGKELSGSLPASASALPQRASEGVDGAQQPLLRNEQSIHSDLAGANEFSSAPVADHMSYVSGDHQEAQDGVDESRDLANEESSTGNGARVNAPSDTARSDSEAFGDLSDEHKMSHGSFEKSEDYDDKSLGVQPRFESLHMSSPVAPRSGPLNAAIKALLDKMKPADITHSDDPEDQIRQIAQKLKGKTYEDDLRESIFQVRQVMRKQNIDEKLVKELDAIIGEDFYKKKIAENVAKLEIQMQIIKRKAEIMAEFKKLQEL